jgi:hypothetical protein
MLSGTDQVVVPYLATDFPPLSPLNGDHELAVTWNDVLAAAVTVGKARRDMLRNGRHSLAELIHRASCMEAYFDRDDDERLVLTKTYTQLDPSEKGVISFYTGMTFAKLYADKVLDIPWMMHISRYESAWSVAYGANTNRPDLFGCNAAGDWAVAEAKGRSRVTAKLLAKMKTQKSAVASIDGVAPMHRYGSATRFERSRLALRVVDPPARSTAQDVPLDPAAWLLDYYRPIVSLLDELNAQRQGGAFVSRLPGTDIEIGVTEDLVSTVRENRQRYFSRPPPRRAEDERGVDPDAEEQIPGERRRRLVDQTNDPQSRAIVERITSSALTVDRDRGGQTDGLYVRALRG